MRLSVHIASLLLLCLLLGACGYLKKNPELDASPLARVGDRYLYLSDLEGVAGQKDSARLVQDFINDWVKHQLILQKAETYLPDNQLDIERKVRQYRESLLIYLYESELINQKLDTSITAEEVNDYYSSFEPAFELHNDVIQFYYIKLSLEAPKMDTARILLQSNKEESRKALADYCYRYAEDFSLSDSAWQKVDHVYKKVPIEYDYLNNISMNKQLGEVKDSLFIYLLKVNDYRPKGEMAPIDYVKDDIRRLILNKRKMKLLKDTYEKVYQDGIKRNDFEIF